MAKPTKRNISINYNSAVTWSPKSCTVLYMHRILAAKMRVLLKELKQMFRNVLPFQFINSQLKAQITY